MNKIMKLVFICDNSRTGTKIEVPEDNIDFKYFYGAAARSNDADRNDIRDDIIKKFDETERVTLANLQDIPTQRRK
jgi:hypothetical protein